MNRILVRFKFRWWNLVPHYHAALCLQLVKVNHDGPSVQVRAVFSLVEAPLSIPDGCIVEGINLPANRGVSV
jgi:hypothetical protein